MIMKQLKTILPALLIAICSSENVQACATCFGQSDSKLADGMSWGILTLIAVAYSVLIGIVAFFGYLIYRSNRMAAQMEISSVTESDVNS
jgi:hypothetical protein